MAHADNYFIRKKSYIDVKKYNKDAFQIVTSRHCEEERQFKLYPKDSSGFFYLSNFDIIVHMFAKMWRSELFVKKVLMVQYAICTLMTLCVSVSFEGREKQTGRFFKIKICTLTKLMFYERKIYFEAKDSTLPAITFLWYEFVGPRLLLGWTGSKH